MKDWGEWLRREVGPGVVSGDRRVPRLPILLRNQVLILLGDEQARLLEGVDEGRVEPGAFHGLGDVMFHLFQRRGLGEEPIVGTGVAAEALPELLPLRLQQRPGLRRLMNDN